MLFRKEVMEQLGQGQSEGQVLIRTPWLLWFFSVIAFVGSCGLLLLMFTGTYTQRIKLSGSLAYDQAPTYVRAAVYSRLNKLLVENGRLVRKGETICVLIPLEGSDIPVVEAGGEVRKDSDSSSIEQKLREQDLQLRNLNLRIQELTIRTQESANQKNLKKRNDADGLPRDSEGKLLAIEMQAPVDGVLQIDEALLNTRLRPGSTVFTIVPAGSRLRAELAFPESALPYVQNGLQVNLRYLAFPYQKFGQYQGTLVQVTNVMMNSTNSVGGEKQYKAYVDLTDQEIGAYGKKIPLREGLVVEADYPTAQRNIVEWIFEPLLAMKGRP